MRTYETKKPAAQAKSKTPFFGKGGGFFSSTTQPTIQRSLGKTIATTDGAFEMGMTSHEGATATPPTTLAVEAIDIKFDPYTTAPYSNEIKLEQIVRDRDTAGTDIEPSSMPPGRGSSLRTTDDPATGVEGGFFTDVLHQNFDNAGNPTNVVPQGAQKGLAYQGNTPVFGFKRSSDPQDIKAAEITDTPSSSGDRDFKFETVAKGEDTGDVFGSLRWSFSTRHGRITNERADAVDNASATFNAAVEKHRNFYVHEPVVFYFDFNSDVVSTTEADKIDAFMDYLNRFPDVRLSLEAYADHRGDNDYNIRLARHRGEHVIKALTDKGIDASRIDHHVAAVGATEQFTSGDLAPNPGRDQDLEANRRGNRRVVLTFNHTVSLPPP